MKSKKGSILCFVLGGLMLVAAGLAAYYLIWVNPNYEFPVDISIVFGGVGGYAALMLALFILGFLLLPKKRRKSRG